MVEFSCEAIWSWAFVCWKIFYYIFNFCACDASVKNLYFFLVHFWKVISAGFFCIYWDNIWFLSFSLLMWCITLIDLWILKNSCIPGIKSTWSWCVIFLICCWLLFARILVRIFASMFISDIGLQFSFLWHLCLVLALGWWWPHRMTLEVCLPLKFYGRVWVG